MKFSDRGISALKPTGKLFEVRDESCKNLALSISKTGVKTFYHRWRHNGKDHRINLGTYPTVSLSEARDKNNALLRARHAGIDPSAPARPSVTVTTLCADYIELWAKPRKRQWETIDKRYLDKEVIPVIGHIEADKLHRREVVNLLNAIVARPSPASANQTLKILKRVFTFAIEQGTIEANPIYMIKMPAVNKQKSRVLSDEEIKIFWKVISNEGKVSMEIRNLLKFILVTGQRPGECNGLSYQEILDGWWTIPPERHKQHKAHTVYLSPLAIYLTRYRNKPYGVQIRSVSHCVRRLIESGALQLATFTPHDLRRTAASGMASIGISHDIIARVLGHSIPGVTSIYNRYDYAEEIKTALMKWASHLESLTAPVPSPNQSAASQ